jgi:hypothetical protein
VIESYNKYQVNHLLESKGTCTHTGKTGAGSDSGAGHNVNGCFDTQPVWQISMSDLNLTSQAGGRLISFNATALGLAHVSEPVGAGRLF